MSQEWFYASNGAQAGPVDTAELKRLVAAGTLTPTDLVWREGLGDWVAASKVKGLFPAAAPVAARGATSPEGYDTAPDGPTPITAPVAPPPAPAAVLPYIGGSPTGGYDTGVTARTIELLSQTRPWVLLMSILMFVVGGLMAFGGLFALVGGLIGGGRSGMFGPMGAFVGLIYVALALLYFVPAIHLSRYASRIAQLRAAGLVGDLESALDAQKSFWKFIGIFTAIVVSVYAVVLLFVLATAFMR